MNKWSEEYRSNIAKASEILGVPVEEDMATLLDFSRLLVVMAERLQVLGEQKHEWETDELNEQIFTVPPL